MYDGPPHGISLSQCFSDGGLRLPRWLQTVIKMAQISDVFIYTVVVQSLGGG